MTTTTDDRKKVTVPDLARMKAIGDRISMITAYDVTFATDSNPGGGQGFEDGGGDARPVGDAPDGHFGDVGVMRDGAHPGAAQCVGRI